MHRSSTVELQLPPTPSNPPPAPPCLPPDFPAARSVPSPLELLYALKRRWLLAVSLGLFIAVSAAATVWMILPAGKHQVRALIQVQPKQSLVARGSADPGYEAFKKNQSILLRTRFLLTRVVGKPKVSQLPMIQSAEDPIKLIEDKIQLRWESPEILAVMLNGDDPAQLKVILDTLVAEYLEDSKSDELKQREARLTLLESTKATLSNQIAAHENNLHKLSQWSGAGESEAVSAIQTQAYSQGLAAVIRERADLKRDLQTKELKRADLEARFKRIDDLPVDAEQVRQLAQQNPRVQEAMARLAAARSVHDKLSTQVTKEHPLYARSRGEVQKTEAEVQAALIQAQPEIEAAFRTANRQSLRQEIDLITEQIKELGRAISTVQDEKRQLEERIATTNKNILNSQLTLDERKPLKEQLDLVNKELLTLRMSQKTDPRVQVREESVIILNQNLNRKLMMAGVAGIGGLLSTVLLVGLLEWRVRRVASVDQVINDLGMRVIGTIPAFPSHPFTARDDSEPDPEWRFVLNESVNAARTMLLHAAKTQSMQVLMVTSATQGEGKTSLASQLASSMATAGMRTLLLDCDLRNPSLHKLFDAPLVPGCSEVLLQEVDVSDAVHPTGVPNLWLIPAGQCTSRVIAALVQGHPLDTLFNRLRGQFDFVVVDSCPILPVADSLLVGQHVDGVVISVMQDISQLPKVVTASEKLVQLSIPLLGAVVNGTKPETHAYGYNYVKQLPA